MIQLQDRSVLLGFAFALAGTALFSLKSIFIKLAYAEGLTADSVLMLRMAFSLPIYLLIFYFLTLKKRDTVTLIKHQFHWILFLGFIGYFLASWLDLKGLETISAGMERLTLFTYPIFTALFGALFFKTPLTRRIIITLALSYIGLWVIYSQEIHLNAGLYNEHDILIGVIFVLFSALTFSFYVLFSKKVILKLGSLRFTAAAMSVSSLFALCLYANTLDFSQLHITNYAWMWVIMLALFSTVIPSFMISEAIARIGPASTGIVGSLGPVMTIALAAIVLNEAFNQYHLIGIICVITGVMLLTIKRNKTS